MANGRHHHNNQNNQPREFFTLGEHSVGGKHYRFRYDGRVYRILERPANLTDEEPEQAETLTLEEADARKAYDAWNHIKRPERFGQ